MMIHVHHTHFTRSAMMCSGGLWFITVCTKGIVVKITFPNHGIAAPPYAYWCACRFKRGQAIACDGKYSQHSCYHAVKDTTKVAD